MKKCPYCAEELRLNHLHTLHGVAGGYPPPRYRFTKANHTAEIGVRAVSAFDALEWFASVDGALLESRLYHGARLGGFEVELAERRAAFLQDGWTEVAADAAQ